MNHYGQQALTHWKRWLPHRFSAISDPQEFFTDLGRQAQQQIGELADQLAGPDQPGEQYLEKVGRLNMARLQAQELVLRELILLDPEPQTQQEPPDEDGMEAFMRAQREINQAFRADWDPAEDRERFG